MTQTTNYDITGFPVMTQKTNYDITGFPVMTQTTNYGITGFLECAMRSHTPLALCTRVHIARCVRNAQRKQGVPYITEPIAIALELNLSLSLLN